MAATIIFNAATGARDVVERYLETAETENLDLLAPHVQVHSPLRERPFVGHDEFREYVLAVRHAFPDLRFEIHDALADRQSATLNWTMHATHEGELGFLPPSGRPVSIRALELYRFDDEGRVREIVTELNPIDLLVEIGLIPAEAFGGGEAPPRPVRWIMRARYAFPRRRGLEPVTPVAPVLQADDESDPDSQTERTRRTARHAVATYIDAGDLSDMSMVAPGLQVHTHVRPEPFQGPDGLREFLTGIRTGFPDARVTIEEIVAEGECAVVRWVMRATNTGELFGLPPSGRRVEISALELLRCDDEGRLCEVRLKLNTVSILRQIGMLPKRLPRPMVWAIQRRIRRQRDQGGN